MKSTAGNNVAVFKMFRELPCEAELNDGHGIELLKHCSPVAITEFTMPTQPRKHPGFPLPREAMNALEPGRYRSAGI